MFISLRLFFTEVIGYNNFSISNKLDEFLGKVSHKKYKLSVQDMPSEIFKLIRENPKNCIYIFSNYLLKIPLLSPYLIYKIYTSEKGYYRSFQDSIIDGMERKNGDIRVRTELKEFINKYKINFLLRSIYIIFLIETISILKKLKSINVIYLDQLDGFPFGAISAFCSRNNLYMCTGSLQIRAFNNNNANVNFLISKGIHDSRLPLKKDLKYLSNLSPAKLDNYIKLIKKDFEEKRDPICNPNYITYEKNFEFKDSQYYRNKLNNKNKNGIVLMHLLTDIARQRNEGLWINNYLEWLYETINNCSKNNDLNWFFKAHPLEATYPILQKHSEDIKKRIKDCNFTYIEPKEKFLHKDVADLASVVITCHGTCKIEYPALYQIPVISCASYQNIAYDSSKLPFTAKNSSEYSELIINAGTLKLSEDDVRRSQELLVFNKVLSGKEIDEEINIYEYKDSNGEKIIRSF